MAEARDFDHRNDRIGDHEATHATILTPEESRQGVVSGRVMTVLAASLTLAFVAFVVVIAVTA
jgi:hypothetical protein